MKPFKPVFLKTYAKQTRKLPAWISPENRKQAFDSTLSTDGDVSVFEPSKPARRRKRRPSVANQKATRPAKKKALLSQPEKSDDEENIPVLADPHPDQRRRTTRGKQTSVSRGKTVRPAKRKSIQPLMESSCDEGNSHRPPPPHPQPAKQTGTVRNRRLVSMPGVTMRQKRQRIQMSESEESTAKCDQNSLQVKRDSTVHPPSVSRFVTRRRRAIAAKPKLPLATSSILNSSDDFAPGAVGPSRFPWPSRRRKRPPAFLVSSAENSLNAAGTVSFATNPFREISLNESSDHSLRACSGKPIFCSTPSAGLLTKHPCPKRLAINVQCSSPPSMSVSSIEVMSTFHEELCSAGPPDLSKYSAPRIELHSEAKLPSSLSEQEHSGDLFKKPEGNTPAEESKGLKRNYVGELPSLNLLSTDDSEHSSFFVSAAGGLEWLIEALKEKCLTDCCTVQLERLDFLTVTQLCSQTTYSSCLEFSGSAHIWQTNEHPASVHSIQTSLDHSSVKNDKTSSYLQSEDDFGSPVREASAPDCQNSNSSSGDCKQPDECSSSKEVIPTSTSHTDSSVEFIMDTQLAASSRVQTLFSEEQAVAVRGKSLTKKCMVRLQKCSLSPVIVQQMKELMQQKEGGLTFGEKSANPDANKSENDTDDPSCSGDITEMMLMSVRQSVSNRGSVYQAKSNETEQDKKAAELITLLKERCLNAKLMVQLKNLTLSQLTEILQVKGPSLPKDVSDSAGDDQTRSGQQSESDTNRSNEDTSVEKSGSTSTEDNITSDKDEVAPKRRKKASQALKEKKRRSTSADRPGTTRKACVSGLSMSRWKNKGNTSSHMFRTGGAQMGSNKAVDCSINELITKQHKQLKEPLGTLSFSTPVRANRLNLSSLLADLTPNTQTWSRLKAALSVHRKGMVLLTPRSLRLSTPGTPRRSALADVSQDLFATPFRTPLSKRLQSQLRSCSSLVVYEDEDLSDAEKVYAECGQTCPLPWEECILPHFMKQCVKIGEGTFGEVFSTTNASGDTVALKIIPLEGSEKVNGEDQKTFGEILHEIIISKELSSLKGKQQNQTHGFIGLNDLHCVQGGYPLDFLKAWDNFDRLKGSENDRPDFFDSNQLFLILEFEFGGSDLENSNGALASLGVAKSILHQVTAALAVAEQELHFEHRDLHWGNVLVKTTKQKTGSFLLNGAVHSLETRGVLVRIIDYSLSRLEIDDLTVSCDISNDEELFMGQGDYQFDIYRLMRQENGNDWSHYHPHTNVLWLHYLCSKLLSMKYRSSGGRGGKDIREELNRFYDNVLHYGSATEALQNCPMFQ